MRRTNTSWPSDNIWLLSVNIIKLCAGSELPYQLAAGLLQVHSGPGWEVLPGQQHEGHQSGQQGEGGSLPWSGGQGQAEIFLDWRGSQQREHPLALGQEIQRRELVQHWRVRDTTGRWTGVWLPLCFRLELPQPDNREGDEVCLAVLNNFYADGIRFHDVSCHHKKPVICQA